VDLQAVGPGAGAAGDGEALGAEAGGDVGVELAARAQLAVRVEGVVAVPVVDVEVDVVGVGLPRQDEAQRRAGGADAAGGGQALLDGGALAGLAGDPGGGDQAEVLAQDALAAGEAAAGVALGEADLEGGKGVLELAGADQRRRQQAVAAQVIGAIGDRAPVGVDGDRAAGAADALEALAGEAAQVGAAREEIDDRAVGAGGERAIAAGLVHVQPDAQADGGDGTHHRGPDDPRLAGLGDEIPREECSLRRMCSVGRTHGPEHAPSRLTVRACRGAGVAHVSAVADAFTPCA
jgi:hypothetical protein